MQVHWIWLAQRPALSDRVKGILLEHFPDPEDLYFATEAELKNISGLSSEGRQALLDKNLTEAEEILADCEKAKLAIIPLADPAYPERLKHISDPPVVLYCRGAMPDLNDVPVIGIVGTRKASAYGLQTAKKMGYQIAKGGGIVISGMAFGIDGMAMSGALMAGAPTVGVLGCGADVVYPLSNRALFKDVEEYGCILSEYPPGMPPAKWTFPRRNRIISGIADGVLVVEAPEKSGALITARHALEQGRDVFVVPGNVDQPGFIGSNRLLKDGAILVSDGWEVLAEYEDKYPGKVTLGAEAPAALSAPEQSLPKLTQKREIPAKKKPKEKVVEKKPIDNPKEPPYIDVNAILPKLSQSEQLIVKSLAGGEKLVDEVIAQTGLTTGKLLASLTMLELKGILKRLPGKRIVLK